MPLTRWQKFVITVRIRYKFPKAIFLIAIPAVVAIIFVFFAFHSGFASFANPLTAASNSQATALKQVEIEALSGNLTALTSKAPLSPSTAPVKQNLYLVVVLAPVIAFTPLIVDNTLDTRRRSHYEQDFADFLFELSELVRGGIDPAKAFLTLAQDDVGSITRFVKTSSRQMAVGFTFEQALQNLGKSLGSPLSSRYIDLVIQASYSGGYRLQSHPASRNRHGKFLVY